MSTGGIYQDLTDVVTCEICYENFEGRDPRLLPCSHGFCCQCIQGVLDAVRKRGPTTDVIPCPICQSPATIPSGNPANLPAHFHSNKIQDIIKHAKDKRSKCIHCKDNAEVSFYCFQCASPMCSSCKTKHDRRNKTHAQIRVTSSTMAHLVCPDHDHHVTGFCVDCSRAVCQTCSMGDHCDHRITDFTCDIEDDEEALSHMFRTHTAAADEALDRITNLQGDFNNNMDGVEDQLDRHLDDVIKQLQHQHKSFCAQIKEMRHQVNQDLDKSRALLIQARECIGKLQRQTESWSEPLPSASEARLACMKELAADIKQQIPSTDSSVTQAKRLVYEPAAISGISLGQLKEIDQQSQEALDTAIGRLSEPGLDPDYDQSQYSDPQAIQANRPARRRNEHLTQHPDDYHSTRHMADRPTRRVADRPTQHPDDYHSIRDMTERPTRRRTDRPTQHPDDYHSTRRVADRQTRRRTDRPTQHPDDYHSTQPTADRPTRHKADRLTRRTADRVVQCVADDSMPRVADDRMPRVADDRMPRLTDDRMPRTADDHTSN